MDAAIRPRIRKVLSGINRWKTPHLFALHRQLVEQHRCHRHSACTLGHQLLALKIKAFSVCRYYTVTALPSVFLVLNNSSVYIPRSIGRRTKLSSLKDSNNKLYLSCALFDLSFKTEIT